MKTLLKETCQNGTKIRLLFSDVLNTYTAVVTNPLHPNQAEGRLFPTEELARSFIAKRMLEIDREIQRQKHYWYQD